MYFSKRFLFSFSLMYLHRYEKLLVDQYRNIDLKKK